MKINLKERKGITLIALIITIVILLILAGVALNIALGDNGIFKRSKQASFEMERAKVIEAAMLANTDVIMDTEGDIDEATIADLTVAKMRAEQLYEIEDLQIQPLLSDLEMDQTSISVNMGKSGIISVLYKGGVINNTRYFVKIQEKYYEMIIQKSNITVERDAVDLDSLRAASAGEQITTTIENANIATIQKTGSTITVTPVATGTTRVKMSNGSVDKVCTVVVTNIIESVTTNKESMQIGTECSDTITATINPSNALGELTWELEVPTGGTAIATISTSGTHKEQVTVSGVSIGNTKLICKNENNTVLKEIPIEVIQGRYTISYNLNGGTNSNTNPTTYKIDSNNITLAEPTKTPYKFAGWTGSGLSSPTKQVVINRGTIGDLNYTANWEKYTFNYVSGTGKIFVCNRRQFNKTNSGNAYVAYFQQTPSNLYAPLLVSQTQTAVYYDTTGNGTYSNSYGGSLTYKGATWYYNGGSGFMDGTVTESTVPFFGNYADPAAAANALLRYIYE